MKNHVIFDIDGTLAKIPKEQMEILESKNPDWEKFYSHPFDYMPNQPICDLARVLIRSKQYKVFFITGRNEEVRRKTLKWLALHIGNIAAKQPLLMRPTGDERHDVEVKTDLYIKNIHPDFTKIALIFDDRDSLVDAWRDSGVVCLQNERGDN